MGRVAFPSPRSVSFGGGTFALLEAHGKTPCDHWFLPNDFSKNPHALPQLPARIPIVRLSCIALLQRALPKYRSGTLVRGELWLAGPTRPGGRRVAARRLGTRPPIALPLGSSLLRNPSVALDRFELSVACQVISTKPRSSCPNHPCLHYPRPNPRAH